jgi:predicted molibdopterin-dependent oxidoreductase YjgC
MDFVIVQSYIMTPLAKSADIILPGLAPFEREGTITNDRGHVQWLRPSLPVQGEAKSDWEILNLLENKDNSIDDLNDIMKSMGEEFPAYSGISFFKLGDRGISLSEIAKS